VGGEKMLLEGIHSNVPVCAVRQKRSRDAALDDTLEGTMDASDAPSTIPNPDRDAAEHDRDDDDAYGSERPQPAR